MRNRWCFLNDHQTRWKRVLSAVLLACFMLFQVTWPYQLFGDFFMTLCINPSVILTDRGVSLVATLFCFMVIVSSVQLVFALNWKLTGLRSGRLEVDLTEEEATRISRSSRILLAAVTAVFGGCLGVLETLVILDKLLVVRSVGYLLVWASWGLYFASLFLTLFLWVCFYSQVSYLLCRVCRSLESSLTAIVESKQLDVRFESWRQRVEKTRRFIESLDDVFSPFLGTAIVFGIVICCLCLYMTVETNNFSALYCAIFLLLFTILTLILFIWSCCVKSAIEHLETVIMTTDLSDVSSSTQNQIQIFLHRIAKPQGNSALHLVNVDQDSLLMIRGTCLTYALVLIQFQPPSSVSATSLRTARMPLRLLRSVRRRYVYVVEEAEEEGQRMG